MPFRFRKYPTIPDPMLIEAEPGVLVPLHVRVQDVTLGLLLEGASGGATREWFHAARECPVCGSGPGDECDTNCWEGF